MFLLTLKKYRPGPGKANLIYFDPKDVTMPTSFLTRDGYRKLQEELDFLRTYKRQEIANRLHEAMEGG